MKTILLLMMMFTFSVSCSAQTNNGNRDTDRVGGYCDGCEGIYEYGNRTFSNVDTLPGFGIEGEKMKITGTVYQPDGKTPASDIILYIYHTNDQGVYPKREDQTGWGRQHGYIRGWVKTSADGKYTFYTSRPGSYPGSTSPAHMHIIVKEPGINEYYLDDYNFSNDPFLTKENRSHPKPKGGSGILTLRNENGLLTAERNIILGLNIQNYPK